MFFYIENKVAIIWKKKTCLLFAPSCITNFAKYATYSRRRRAFTAGSVTSASFVVLTSQMMLTHCAHPSAAVLLTGQLTLASHTVIQITTTWPCSAQSLRRQPLASTLKDNDGQTGYAGAGNITWVKNEPKGSALARIREGLKENMKMHLDLVHVTQDRDEGQALVNAAMKLRVPNNDVANSLTSSDTTSFSRTDFSTESH